MPIAPENVTRLDGVLITHRDNDQYSIPTCRALARVCRAFHSTQLVTSLMKKERLPATGHNIGSLFEVGPVRI